MKKQTRGSLTLLLTAIIWGAAFVAQSAGMDYVGPFTYNTLRSILGAIALVPVMILFNRNRPADITREQISSQNRLSAKAGFICGIFLSVASCLQQLGICLTTVGKAGFITAIYIIIVPLLGIFVGKKVSITVWISVFIAILGFYFLCINEGFSIALGDIYILCCAFVFSLQILAIDHFTAMDVDPVKMSCVQFITVAVLSSIPMFLFDTITLEGIWAAKWTIAYAGFLSSGVAYTLQIFGQRDSNPAVATLIMSLESVFSALFGWLLLHEHLSVKELTGCAMVFAAVLLAQSGDMVKK